MEKQREQQLEHLGAFEVGAEMLKFAQQNQKENLFLNAGRGNPNWINTKARLAFARLVAFGVKESQRTLSQGDLAGSIEASGIQERLQAFLTPDTSEIDAFLMELLDFGKRKFGFNGDAFVKELADGVIGNDYPVPSRVLSHTEVVLNHYLQSTLYHGVDLQNQTNIFPTEGGTAAIVYIFQALKENNLIRPGDKIALNTPIFPPYIAIPELNDYELLEVDLTSKEADDWQISPSEIEKLKGDDVKALFIVNPSNPGSMAFNESALQAVQQVVKEKPELMIITDDVYGTFVSGFQSVYSIVPHNTLLVYSFSKLFGATGWRLGLIAAHEKNVFDKLLAELSSDEQQLLEKRYESVVAEPKKMPFLERIVAESRSIGLYHTSGLSTPQQIMEVLFAFTHLLAPKRDDVYNETAKKLVAQRYKNLHEALEMPENHSRQNAKYYTIVDIPALAEKHYGEDFRHYLENQFEPIDFLIELAKKNGVALVDGVGFGADSHDLRVSEANLPTEDYTLIGKQILELLAEYHQQFEKD